MLMGPDRIRPKIRTQQEIILRFCLRFILWCGLLYFFMNWVPSPVIADPVNRQTAWMTAVVLGVLGSEPVLNDVFVSAGGFSIKIITECSAIFAAILFFSFIMAYPATVRQKLTGLCFGLPFLFSVNLIRIVTVFYTGMKFRPLFEVFHAYIGQIIMIFLVLMASMVWLNSIVHIKTKDRPPAFMMRFIAWSGLPFLTWLYLDEVFVMAHFYLIKGILGVWNYSVDIPEKLEMYPHTFNSFNMVAFTSLILATNSVNRIKKVKSLCIGLFILCCTFFLFKLHQILFIDFHIGYAFRPFIALIIINQWILPFVLWLYLMGKEIFKRKGIYECPICGAEKVGIIDHIRNKHGKASLKAPAVKQLLEHMP